MGKNASQGRRMLLGPPTPPKSSVVFRIERRHAVAHPTPQAHKPPPSLAARPCPFASPTPHLWSLRMPDRDAPHIVLLHDRSDARVMATSLNAHAAAEHFLPTQYEHLKTVFGRYYGQPSEGFGVALLGDDRLHAEECDFDATLRWALTRQIGVISIAKIHRQPQNMQFVVPMTILSPDDSEAFANADAALAAFTEDFAWQLSK